jgi:hypothetical protein
MPAHHKPWPAVFECPAVAEIAEFARRASQPDFGLANRRVVVAALLRASEVSPQTIMRLPNHTCIARLMRDGVPLPPTVIKPRR